LKREPGRDESDQACFMVQGNNSIEVISDTHLDDTASSSNDHDSMDAQALNAEFIGMASWNSLEEATRQRSGRLALVLPREGGNSRVFAA